MSGLWLPKASQHRPKVSHEHAQGTVAYRTQLMEMLHETPITPHWDRELAKIDHLLRLRKAKEHAHLLGVRPGFYHLIRLNEEGPPWVQVIEYEDQYVEPTSDLLEALRACDLQNDRVVRDRVAHDELADRRKARADELERERRIEEARERVAAMTRTQVLTSSDVPWAQNSAGRNRPTRGRGR
jgi:hypothetical protein